MDYLCVRQQANFESDVRSKYLELLGYNKEELALKVSCPVGSTCKVEVQLKWVFCTSNHFYTCLFVRFQQH